MMPHAEEKQLRKGDERALMLALQQRRESVTPKHVSPDWVAAYWQRMGS